MDRLPTRPKRLDYVSTWHSQDLECSHGQAAGGDSRAWGSRGVLSGVQPRWFRGGHLQRGRQRPHLERGHRRAADRIRNRFRRQRFAIQPRWNRGVVDDRERRCHHLVDRARWTCEHPGAGRPQLGGPSAHRGRAQGLLVSGRPRDRLSKFACTAVRVTDGTSDPLARSRSRALGFHQQAE